MRPIATLEAFRLAVLEAGLGELPPDELAFLKIYYDDAYEIIAGLDEALGADDEPATIFWAGSAT